MRKPRNVCVCVWGGGSGVEVLHPCNEGVQGKGYDYLLEKAIPMNCIVSQVVESAFHSSHFSNK